MSISDFITSQEHNIDSSYLLGVFDVNCIPFLESVKYRNRNKSFAQVMNGGGPVQ